MDLHNLKPAKGATKSRKRIARGEGSGKGGTSTRGHKGAKSRSGYKRKRGFEGGQMPLQMRLPKRGFKSPNRVVYIPFNLDRISQIIEKSGAKEITISSLYEMGVIKKRDKVKILGKGDLAKKINLSVHACSASAKEKIEAKGGAVSIVDDTVGKKEKTASASQSRRRKSRDNRKATIKGSVASKQQKNTGGPIVEEEE